MSTTRPSGARSGEHTQWLQRWRHPPTRQHLRPGGMTCSAVAPLANSPTSPTSPPPADRPRASGRRHHTAACLCRAALNPSESAVAPDTPLATARTPAFSSHVDAPYRRSGGVATKKRASHNARPAASPSAWQKCRSAHGRQLWPRNGRSGCSIRRGPSDRRVPSRCAALGRSGLSRRPRRRRPRRRRGGRSSGVAGRRWSSYGDRRDGRPSGHLAAGRRRRGRP
jgi:hypothetical protein